MGLLFTLTKIKWIPFVRGEMEAQRFLSLLCSQNQFAFATEVFCSLSRAGKVSFMDSCTALYMTATYSKDATRNPTLEGNSSLQNPAIC